MKLGAWPNIPKPGRIHLRCPGCGRIASNVDRNQYDPPEAHIVVACCEKCCNGHPDCQPQFQRIAPERFVSVST